MAGTTCGVAVLVTVILAGCKFCKADPLCNGTHSELVYPKLYHSGTPIDLHNVKDHHTLTMVFTWRKEPIHILLEQHSVVTDDSVVEIHNDVNDTVDTEGITDNRTHFQGHVVGARFSFVAIALGDFDMTGYVHFDGEGVYIEPLHQEKGPVDVHRAQSCGRKPVPRAPYGAFNTPRSQTRYRRAPNAYTKFLEVLLVADSTVVEVVGRNRVKTYLLTLMSIVNEVYHDPSLGQNIEVVTVKIIYMDKSTESHVIVTSDPQRTVDQFCYWASTQTYRSRRYARQTAGSNHDSAVLLTRHKFTAAGYAPITGMCVPMRNCAFVKDEGFTSAFVIAHEVGHVFGLMHDGHGNNCYGRSYTTSIMATRVQSAFNRYWWSGCSKTRMQEVIGGLTCLNNNPRHVIKENLPDPLGLKWTLDEQCSFEFGHHSKHCRYFGSDPCAQMWCTAGVAYQCKTKNVIPLDGTHCGRAAGWYCLKGVCGYHGNEKSVDGNWGQWSKWSSCSAECGVGFKRRSRLCDSPKPQFGGKECDGQSDNADTCKAKTCTDYEDPRAYQCSVMDIVPVKGATHEWLPYQTNTLSDRCKLSCISVKTKEVVTFDSLVDNGTPCSYDEYNSICIDGKCQSVGCDGVRDSQKKEDKCGVCQGDGSTCKTVAGVYAKKFEYSASGQYYEKMLVLPKGARAISIAENSQSSHFLSVQDTYYGHHVFNADGKQGRSKHFALEGAWFKYSNNGGHETLDTKGPIQRDVNVMIYPMNWKYPANVRFSYIVDKNDYTYEKTKYRWKYMDWSECSVTCGEGVQHIIYACHDRETGDIVDDDSCKYLDSQESDDVKCVKPDCSSFFYMWRLLRNHSECSASCGDEGVHHLLYECEERETNQQTEPLYCANIPEPKIVSPCNRFPCTQVSYRWDVTPIWSECSFSCGDTGTQHQLFYCVRETEGDEQEERVDEKFCSDMVSPKEPRPCNRHPCQTYDWKTMVTWLECNETCGDTGMQRKKVVCHKYAFGEKEKPVGIWYCKNTAMPRETRPCNRRECFTYQWDETEEYGECSHTCGSAAVKLMKLYCKKVTYDNREGRVPQHFCDEIDKPNVEIKCDDLIPCNTYEWATTTNWTSCSQTCGNDGIQTNVNTCIALPSKEVVSNTYCENSISLAEERPCNRFPCQNYEIRYGEDWYPECPEDCNDTPVEMQSRTTECFQIFDNGLSEKTDHEYCSGSEKPPLMLRPCEHVLCPKYEWEESGWSPCSITCGGEGVETRIVVCIEVQGDGTRAAVDEDRCADVPRLDVIQRPCRLQPCLRYMTHSDWSDCSVTCGIGTQSQHVTCLQKTSEGTEEEEIETEICEKANLTKPSRTCEPGACGFLEWGAGPWSMCSRTCGAGKQKRIVYCGDPLKKADPSRCPGQQPAEYQDCQIQSCRGTRKRCLGDRAAFCKRASTRLCKHPAYKRVCCASCGEIQQDQPRRRYRNYWDYYRRHFRYG